MGVEKSAMLVGTVPW